MGHDMGDLIEYDRVQKEKKLREEVKKLRRIVAEQVTINNTLTS